MSTPADQTPGAQPASPQVPAASAQVTTPAEPQANATDQNAHAQSGSCGTSKPAGGCCGGSKCD